MENEYGYAQGQEIEDDDIIIEAEYIDTTTYSIAQIAKENNMSPSTVRLIVTELEKRFVLSTSNKESNKHRRLTQQDRERICSVIELIRGGETVTAAAEKVADELQAKEKDSARLTHQPGPSMEFVTAIVKAIGASIAEDREQTKAQLEEIYRRLDEKIENENETKQKLMELSETNAKQAEVIEELSKKLAEKEQATVETLYKQIELLNEENQLLKQTAEKKKKFFGLF